MQKYDASRVVCSYVQHAGGVRMKMTKIHEYPIVCCGFKLHAKNVTFEDKNGKLWDEVQMKCVKCGERIW